LKINSDEHKLETDGFDQFQQKGFSIKQSARAFEVLSSNLYSNKVKAIVRELGCNAWDAHVEREKLRKRNPKHPHLAPSNQAFEITLPNTWSPMFVIRDYGIGLSNEDVLGLYTTYFGSTKEQSNDTIGAFGLGSKSPFCYTDQFTVTSFFNGTKSTYQAFIGEDGAPAIALLSSEPTSEKNGIQISLSAKASDFNSFKDNTQEVFKWFTTDKPLVKGQNPFWLSEPEAFNGKKWSHFYRTTNTVSFFVRQGNVVYLVDVDSFSTTSLSQTHKSLLKYSFVVDVPIGSVNVTASRERLNYDRNTEAYLVKMLDGMHKEIVDDLKTEISDTDTQWKAVDFFNKRIRQDSFYSPLVQGLSLKNGLKLEHCLFFDLRKETKNVVPDPKDPTKTLTVTTKEPVLTIYFKSYHRQDSITYGSFSPGDYTLVFDDLHVSSFWQKYDLNRVVDGKKVWLIRRVDKNMSTTDALTLICKQFGDVDPKEILKFSSLPDPVKAPKRTTQTRKLLKLNPSKSAQRSFCFWEDATHDMSKGGYFVYTYAGSPEGFPSIGTAINEAYSLNLLNSVEVFGVPRGSRDMFNKDVAANATKWEPFKTYLKDQVLAFSKKYDFEKTAVLKRALSLLPLKWRAIYGFITLHNLTCSKQIMSAVQAYNLYLKLVEPVVSASLTINKYIALGHAVGVDVQDVFSSEPEKTESDYKLGLTKETQSLKTKYPLVDLLDLPEKPTQEDLTNIQAYLS